jgi:hypothetical protein
MRRRRRLRGVASLSVSIGEDLSIPNAKSGRAMPGLVAYICESGGKGRGEHESLILAQNERWRHA